MLFIFRRFQKAIFFTVTFAVVCSFVFFGAYQALVPTKVSEAPVLFTTHTGEKVTTEVFQGLRAFLSSESMPELKYAPFGNFLNDDLISNEFLTQKIGYLLWERYQEGCRDAWMTKHLYEEGFRPYQHPGSSSVSASQVWQFLSPQLPVLLDVVQKQPVFSKEGFDARVQLYQEQKKCPGYILARFLRYFEQQNKGIAHDSTLDNSEMLLFGYRTLEDWFGAEYMHVLTRIVLEGASLAKQKGYVVTPEEVQVDLLGKAQKTFSEIQQSLPSSMTHFLDLYHMQLRLLQMSEALCSQVYTEVLYFKKLMDDIGAATLVDHVVVDAFNEYASENYEVEKISCSKELAISNAKEMRRLETYFSLIGSRLDVLAIPEVIDSVEEIAQRAPDLIVRSATLSYKTCHKRTLIPNVSLLDIWKWQESDDGWKQLSEVCSFIDGTCCERGAYIDGLSDVHKRTIDDIAALAIIDTHPEWIEQAIDTATPHEITLFFHPHISFPLEGITDHDALWERLLSEEKGVYSQDGMNYYEWTPISTHSRQLIPFSALVHTTILDPYLVDMTPFIKALYEYAKQHDPEIALLDQGMAHDLLVQYRFGWPLEHQTGFPWPCETEHVYLSRAETPPSLFEQITQLAPGDFSPVYIQDQSGYKYQMVGPHPTEEKSLLLCHLTQALEHEAKQSIYLRLAEYIDTQDPTWAPLT